MNESRLTELETKLAFAEDGWIHYEASQNLKFEFVG